MKSCVVCCSIQIQPITSSNTKFFKPLSSYSSWCSQNPGKLSFKDIYLAHRDRARSKGHGWLLMTCLSRQQKGSSSSSSSSKPTLEAIRLMETQTSLQVFIRYSKVPAKVSTKNLWLAKRLNPSAAEGAGVLISAARVNMWKGIKERWTGRPQRQGVPASLATNAAKRG